MSKLKLLVLSPSKDLLQQRLFSCMIRTNCGNPLTPYTYFITYIILGCKRFLYLNKINLFLRNVLTTISGLLYNQLQQMTERKKYYE